MKKKNLSYYFENGTEPTLCKSRIIYISLKCFDKDNSSHDGKHLFQNLEEATSKKQSNQATLIGA